jgi:predicted amidophosphoribosyltransferase
MTTVVTKRCPVCGRFRPYDPDDDFCIGCGHEGLESECTCGRSFESALAESGDIHCPRGGRVLRGRAPEFGA